MSQIIIHGFAASTYVRTARMAAMELGLDHVLKPLDFRSESHLALHPFAKMPVLTDGTTTVWESLAIMAYLEEKAGSHALFPVQGDARWRNLTACSAALDYAYQPLVHGDDEAAATLADTVLSWADAWLGKAPCFAGQDAGAADLFFAPMISYRLSKHSAESVFEGRATLERWFSKISQRGSFEGTSA